MSILIKISRITCKIEVSLKILNSSARVPRVTFHLKTMVAQSLHVLRLVRAACKDKMQLRDATPKMHQSITHINKTIGTRTTMVVRAGIAITEIVS